MKIGLALGGGAARGIAHIGVLQYLAERNITPSLIAGTSAGSIVGSLYCSGKTPQEIAEIALTLSLKDFVKLTIPKKGLLSSALLLNILEEHLSDLDFKDLKIPLKVNAVDLISGQKVVLEEGPVAKAVQASCAIPGIFTPVNLGSYLCVDGGLLDNVPVGCLLEDNLDYIIAVDVGSHKPLEKEPASIFEILMQSFDIVRRQRDLFSHQHADLVIAPDLAETSLWDVSKAGLLIEKGYSEAKNKLQNIDFAKKRRRPFSWLSLKTKPKK